MRLAADHHQHEGDGADRHNFCELAGINYDKIAEAAAVKAHLS